MPSASTSPTPSLPSPAGHAGVLPSSTAAPIRAVRGLAALGAAALMLFCGVASAWAVTPTFSATASPSAPVGLQIFDHVSLMASATGTITFRLYEPGDTSCQSPVFTSTVTVSGTGSDNSQPYNTPVAGTYQWLASYSGDANDDPISSVCGQPSQSVIINKAFPVGSVTASTNGSGQIHGTASLQGGFAPLSGTVTFTVTGPGDMWCAGTQVYTRTVPVNGAGTYDSGWYTPTAAGTYTYRIRYAGDANNNGVGPTPCMSQNNSIALTQSQIASGPATFVSPTNGGVMDDTMPFSWTAASGAQQYALWIGTTSGGYDVAATALSPSTLSYDVPTLPTGRTLYARLWTETGGAWSSHQDISFTTSKGAVFTSPYAGQSSFTSGSLTWSGVDTAQQYAVWIGTTSGGYDVGAGTVGAGVTSFTAPLPVGRTLHARVWTMVGGVWTRYDDVTFTPTGGATFTAPTDGQTGVDPTQSLSWSPISGAQDYVIWIGTTPGGYDLGGVEGGTSMTSYTPANIPHGRRIYARVWTMAGGAWTRYQDVSYTTA